MSSFVIQDQHVGPVEFTYTRAGVGVVVKLVSVKFTTKAGKVVEGGAMLVDAIVADHYEAINAALSNIGLLHKPSYRKVLGR